MDKRTIIFTVTNDLVTDQRMHRICTTMSDAGYAVMLVGRKLADSEAFDDAQFQSKRLSCLFTRGPLFYLEYNLRLLLLLTARNANIICSIDMDTLWSGWMASRLRGSKLVYDAHEYFSESPELEGRNFKKRIWQWSEKWLIPRVDLCYTVSASIAEVFSERFKRSVEVVRNLPVSYNLQEPLKENGEYMIYQGALNAGRGLEQLIACMDEVPIPLYLAGDGDCSEALRKQAEVLPSSRVRFLGKLNPVELRKFTSGALFGFNLLEPMGLSYQYSLANKFFDYIMAGIPQICTSFKEYQQANSMHEVAVLINDLDRSTILSAIDDLMKNKARYLRLKENTQTARKSYNWEQEAKHLIQLFEHLNE